MKRLFFAVPFLSAALFVGTGTGFAGVSGGAGLHADQESVGAEHGLPPSLTEGGDPVLAKIVDREGDEFVAKTEDGHELRLPVEGAPSDIDVGADLRLVPDPETHTIHVYKAGQTDTMPEKKSGSEL